MTQEDKELLLKDLCARLSYGVKAKVFSYWNDEYYDMTIWGLDTEEGDVFCNIPGERCEIDLVKPYLRPMSSMTEEEREKLQNLIDEKLNYGIDSENEWSPWVLHDSTGIKNMIGGERFYFDDMSVIYDWLNAHYFDYRGLIPMGLALEAPEGMYNENTK